MKCLSPSIIRWGAILTLILVPAKACILSESEGVPLLYDFLALTCKRETDMPLPCFGSYFNECACYSATDVPCQWDPNGMMCIAMTTPYNKEAATPNCTKLPASKSLRPVKHVNGIKQIAL